jgi:hypothetical protein
MLDCAVSLWPVLGWEADDEGDHLFTDVVA